MPCKSPPSFDAYSLTPARQGLPRCDRGSNIAINKVAAERGRGCESSARLRAFVPTGRDEFASERRRQSGALELRQKLAGGYLLGVNAVEP
jgi:hypothetical protein